MTTQANLVLRHVRGLAVGGDVPDGQLLERFAARRDEAAFAALLRRHGPLVYGVCRRVLHNEHDAEDAFQATFLVLARKAASIAARDAVGSWLYQVARNVAMKARKRTDDRKTREGRAAARRPADPLEEISGRELLAVIDEELEHLSERDRAPLVLCYLQGLTRDEAARRLGCSESTLHRRLDGARERLRKRLERRGLALSAALLATATASAAVPTTLTAATVRSAAGKAADVPAAVAALVRQALRATAVRTPKAVGAALVAATLLATGAVLLAPRTPAAAGGDPVCPTAEAPKAPAERRPEAPPADKQQMTVSVLVLDADGKPVPGAKVAAVTYVEPPYRGRTGHRDVETSAGGTADAEGRYRLTLTATTGSRPPLRSEAVRPPAAERPLAAAARSRPPLRQVLAAAPGHGLGWCLLPLNADKADVVVHLPPEQVIRGRLIDLQGQPVKEVKLHVAEVAVATGPGSFTGSATGGSGTFTATDATNRLARAGREAPDWFAPVGYPFATAPARLDVWPAALTTDAEGRFVVRGLGSDRTVTLRVTDERFSPQDFVVRTTPAGKPEAFEEALDPAHWLEGRVVGDDTGQPVGKVLLRIAAFAQARPPRRQEVQAWTDEQGRFRVNCPPGNLSISPYPADGSPYLTQGALVNWPKGKVKHEVEVRLPRGVVVRGKVSEADSGKPVAGATVTYFVRDDNPFSNFLITSWRTSPGEFVQTRADGTFAATVYPGVGTLLAKGPTRDYVLQRLDTKELHRGQPGGAPIYAEAVAPLDLKAGADPQEVSLKLRRGVTIRGRALDPDGKPVKEAVLYYAQHLQDNGDRAYFYHYAHAPVAVTDGRFELTGCDPKEKFPVYILDRRKDVGLRVVLSAAEAKDEVTVRLQPCGKAAGRYVDDHGKPLKGTELYLRLILDAGVYSEMGHHELIGRENQPRSNGDGRVTAPGLIPGATYRYTSGGKQREFTAESGKTRDLGEMVPQRGFGGGSGGAP